MKKFFDFIFSMQFAGTLLLVFAAAIGTATFIENDFGTVAAQTLVYKATWFELLLLLSAISLIGSVFKYKLYKRKRYSVLFFHLAFVVMLIGAAITRFYGYEGTMMIREGESSNQIITDVPYVQLTVNDGNSEYQFHKAKIFTQFKRNHFNKTFEFNGNECNLEYVNYLPNAAQTVVEDPSGEPIIAMVSVENGGRRNVFLRSGECDMVSGMSFCFDKENNDPNTVRISSEGDSLSFIAPFNATVMDMMANTTDSLPKNLRHPLDVMKLYNFNGEQVVLKAYYKHAVIKMVSASNDPKSSNAGAVVFNLSYKGKKKEISVMGGKGMIGQPVSTNIEGVNFSVEYGSRLITIPFSIKLRDFQLERYPGSMSPASFASEVTVLDPSHNVEMPYRIFMNNILNYGGFRFFQSSYDKDEKGTILSVNHDKWGTRVTYFGYFFMAAGLIFNFFSRNSRFRKLMQASKELNKKAPSLKTLAVLLIAGTLTMPALAQNNANFNPLNISKSHAAEFGSLLVQAQGGRTEPINTTSSEILRKVHRKDKLMGLNSDQVILGMLSNPAYWQTVPMIKVSDSQLKNLIGISGSYASFNDFLDMTAGAYKLASYVDNAYNKKPAERNSFDKDLMRVDERVNICYMIYSGSFLNIFPKPDDPNHKWYSSEDPYTHFDSTDAGFVSSILPVYYTTVINGMKTGDWSAADKNLSYIKLFQDKYGKDVMPSKFKTKLEIFYNKANIFERLFPIYGTLGFILLILLFVGILNPRLKLSIPVNIMIGLIILAFLIHMVGLIMRWYIAGHAPWSNGYETMIYISWAAVLSGILFTRTSKITLAITAILASLMLMVAHLSWLDPQITNLVPVLRSYWLVIHVAVITASYAFLSIGALLGLLNLLLISFQTKKNFAKIKLTIEELTNINEMNLIIGVFLVTIGTFLGGVWANESWGRYWGWDPKETWALVTILVYAFIVHMRLIPGLNGVYAFNFAALIGFSSVMMTYFGVNYYLSGMHSYAKGDPVPIPTFVYYVVVIITIVSIYSYIRHVKMSHLKNPEK